MARLKYGYIVKNGKLEVDPVKAEHVTKLFELTLQGNSLSKASELAGSNPSASHAALILQDATYIGSNGYPQIVSEELFHMVSELLEQKRAYFRHIRNLDTKKAKREVPKSWNYSLEKAETTFEDPKLQAEYIWSLISRA